LQNVIEEKRSVVVGQIYGGIGSGEKPQWVECIKEGVILQPQGRQIDLAGLNSFPALLQAIRQKGYVVFLVQPQGFEAFQLARALAISQGAKVGYEPVDEKWVLRFGENS
jgi:hypothetical protein